MSLSGQRLVGPGRSASGATQFFIQLAQMNPTQQYNLRRFGLRGAFAVSDDTFYTEYNFKLFRWKPGDTDTELEETVELSLHIARRSLKLAVSGDTVRRKTGWTLSYRLIVDINGLT